MHKRIHTPASPHTSGFTLIEVLIALVVFSIGLLGLAGMQMQGLKYNHDSYLRSQATLMAYDLLDRMRSNPTSAGSYVVDDSAITTLPTNCASTSANCDSAALVAFDLYEWKTAITTTLPKGTGKVVADTVNTSPQNYIITLTWVIDGKDPDKDPSASAATFQLRTAP